MTGEYESEYQIFFVTTLTVIPPKVGHWWSGKVSGQVRLGVVRLGQVMVRSGEFGDQVDKISFSEF
jgi:hypothetical protein